MMYWLPQWLSGEECARQCRRCGFDLWVGTIPWRRKWQPVPVFLPGKSYGQRSLEGYSPGGRNRVGHDWATKQQQIDVLGSGPVAVVSAADVASASLTSLHSPSPGRLPHLCLRLPRATRASLCVSLGRNAPEQISVSDPQELMGMHPLKG